MAPSRCPQCSAEVAADETHCNACGFPLEWQAGGDEAESQPADMVRRPGEDSAHLDTRMLSPAPETQPPPPDHDTAGAVLHCPTCGATNPAHRTLCERCGMGLAESSDLMAGQRWWQHRAARVLLITVVVLAGVVVGWRVFGGAGTPDPIAGGTAAADEGTAASPTPTAQASQPAVILQRGDNDDDVLRYQQLLVQAGLELRIDGDFGPATEEATRSFQRTIGVEPTGRVTTRTMAAAASGEHLRRVRIFLLRDGELDGVTRRVDETQLARGALEMLVAAPLLAERDEGLTSAIPRGTEVRDVRVERGRATVSLSGFAEDPDDGSLRQRVGQVVRTLTRFDAIDEVRLQLPPDDAAVFSQAGVAITGREAGDG